jgi:hypothetical protein
MKKGYADRIPTARLAQLLPQQRLYSSPDAQAGIIATDFSSVDIQMSIMNRHPPIRKKSRCCRFRVSRNMRGQQLVPSRLTSQSQVRRQGGAGSCPGPSGS